MPRHPEVLLDITNTAADFVLENPQPSSIPGASLSRAMYTHRTTHERWLAKAPVQQEASLTRNFILREKIANDIYAYYGIGVPRLAMAELPCHYWLDDATKAIYEQELGLTHAPHLLSRWLDRFRSYPDMPVFAGGEVMRLNVDDQLIPEVGLGHILAVAHFIQDIDVIGGSGGNIGYRLHVDGAGTLYTQSYKIDPGEAFTDHDKTESLIVSRHIRLATTHSSQASIAFEQLPQRTQREFMQTTADILQTPTSDIKRFFIRRGTEALQQNGFTKSAIQLLTARQSSFKNVFKAELTASSREPYSQEAKTTSGITLAPELQPIYAQAQLAKTNPIYKQAQHFYIEPDTTLTRNTEEKSQAFTSMLQEFLDDKNARTLLLLGDSGLGKSTATEQLNQQSWEHFITRPNPTHRIPIRIELKQFTSLTVKRCVENTLLDDYHLSPAQMTALKQRPCLIILDGFDEIGGRAKCNLWESNQLSQWKNVRLIVTCRGTYLNEADIREYFAFGQRNNGLMKRYLSPFNTMQITTYLQKTLVGGPAKSNTLVTFFSNLFNPSTESKSSLSPKSFQASSHSKEKNTNKPLISSETVKQLLKDSPQLADLLQVPLMLKIFVEAFPRLHAESADLTRLNRFTLYQAFMQEWFERNRARLSQNLSTAISESICERFLIYSEDLAFELFKAKQTEVDYAPGEAPWDQFFSQLDEDSIQLRSGCPLKRVGNQYSFIHKSFFEFFVAQKILRQTKVPPNAREGEVTQTLTLQHLMDVLMTRPLTEEEQILNFLYEASQATQLPTAFIPFLFSIIHHSATAPDIASASSNAATILNVCEVPLTSQQWAGVQLPNADLSYCALAHSDLSGANLRGANLIHCMLYQVNLTGADLREVQWGEYPWLQMKGGVQAIAHHPTQPWIAITQRNTLVIKNSDTDTLIGQPMVGHPGSVTSVAFSHDGARLVSGSWDKTVRVWDVQTQKPIGHAMLGHTEKVNNVALSQDGAQVVSGSDDKTLRLWDARTQKPFGQLMEHTARVTSVAFSPDGTKVVSGSWQSMQLWDARTQKLIGQPMKGHSNYICSIAFNHDGTKIASGSHDNTVRLWDPHTQKLIGQPMTEHTNWVTSVAFNHDGTQMVSGSRDHTVRLWDPQTQKPIGQPMMGHTGDINSVVFSSDGTQVVSGSDDKTVRFWDLQTQKPFRQLIARHSDSINGVAFSNDGTQAVSGSSDHTLRLWDPETQQPIGQPMMGHSRHVESIAFSRDGTKIVSASYDNTLRLWDIKTQKPIGQPMRGHSSFVQSVAFNHDDTAIISGSHDNTVRLWDPQTQKPIGQPMKGHTRSINSVAFNHNGTQVVSGSSDGTVCLWDTYTQKLIGEPMTGHKQQVTCVAFSPDGTQIASGSWDDALRLWNPKTQELIGPPITARFSINNLAFSPDGTQIISAAWDILQLWDVNSILTTGHSPEIILLTWHQHILSFAFAPRFSDRRNRSTPSKKEDRLVIGDKAGAISFWAVSYEPSPHLRFLGMPKHPSMPLFPIGAQLLNCQMSATSRRLLKQNGANVTGVRVVNETEQAAEEKISPYATSSSTFFATTTSSQFSSHLSTAPVLSTSSSTTQTTIPLEYSPAKMALGKKVIALVDVLAAYLSTIQQQTPAENLSQAITYASTVVRALSKGTNEYQNVLTNPENYCIPQAVKDFMRTYIHDHGLQALMEHPDFARSLSIQLSYAAQTPPPVGKKDFAALRAEYAPRRRLLSPAGHPAALLATSAHEQKPSSTSATPLPPPTGRRTYAKTS